jgi:curli biogenesis system outer membrane secretion channel CsgG
MRSSGETYDSAKKRAIDNGRSNLLAMLERQYLDLNSTTIGAYLSLHPEKRPIVDRFIGTARLFSESEDGGKVKVSLTLFYTGPDSYQSMIAQLQGKETPAETGGDESGQPDETTLQELRDKFVSKTPEEMGKPYNIALFDFDNKTAYKTADIGAVFSEALAYAFKKDRRFIFADLKDSSDMLRQNSITIDDLKDSPVTKNVPLKGVDGVIFGAVSKYESQVKKHGIGGTGYLEMSFDMEIELRILDARTGRWVFYDTVPVNVSERTFTMKSADDADNFIDIDHPQSDRGLAGKAFGEMLAQVGNTIRASFPLEGYILKTDADTVFINLAKADGVKEDDILTVYRLGDVLTDPVTGKALDRIREKIGTIKIVDVQGTYSQAQTEDIFAEKPAPGDVVMLR